MTTQTPDASAGKDLDGLQLDTDDATLLCAIINAVGTGMHPTARPETLKYFMAPYAIECLQRAMPKLTEQGQAKANKILMAINLHINPALAAKSAV